MNLHARLEALPKRLRRALWVWLGLSPLAAVLPATGNEALGVLAHPGFWCGLLPLIALAPSVPGLLRELAAHRRVPRRSATRRQARRRGRAQQRTPLAA